MRQVIFICLVLILAGCGLNNAANKRVFIRNNGNIVTTYELDGGSRILRSVTKDRNGIAVTREYSYNSRNELAAVTRKTPYSGGETLYINHERDKADPGRLTRTTKTLSGSRSTGGQFEVTYYYTEDGQLEGMMQTDANGNVQAKCAGD
ncbi:MAG: hypothetical protein JW969_20440 [Spirochaetales bacterium]|nr:hypothetical protein [Spirochaetales bacterium]